MQSKSLCLSELSKKDLQFTCSIYCCKWVTQLAYKYFDGMIIVTDTWHVWVGGVLCVSTCCAVLLMRSIKFEHQNYLFIYKIINQLCILIAMLVVLPFPLDSFLSSPEGSDMRQEYPSHYTLPLEHSFLRNSRIVHGSHHLASVRLSKK